MSENKQDLEVFEAEAMPITEEGLSAEQEAVATEQVQPINAESVETPVDAQYLQAVPYYQLINQPSPEADSRKKDIKRLSNASILPLLIYWGAGEIISYFLMIVLAVALGYDGMSAVFSNSDFIFVFNGVLSITLFSLPFLITTGWTRNPLSKTLITERCGLGKALSVIMLGFGVSAGANYANNIFATLFNEFFGEPVQSTMPEYGKGLTSFIINIICVAIIPALMEEFAFRGVILQTTRKYTSDGFAIFTNAILFSLLHGNLQQIPFTFIFGLYLAYITVYTGSVVPAMIVHAINNGLAVTISVATADMSPLNSMVVSGLYFLVSLLIGLCGLIFVIKSDNGLLKISKERSEDTKTVAKYYFTSPCFIIFAAVTILKILMVQMAG